MSEEPLELLAVHCPALVAVKPLKDGVVELGQLLRQRRHVDAEVGLDQPHRLEGLPELPALENPVFVQV
jgi:hypothetical protein